MLLTCLFYDINYFIRQSKTQSIIIVYSKPCFYFFNFIYFQDHTVPSSFFPPSLPSRLFFTVFAIRILMNTPNIHACTQRYTELFKLSMIKKKNLHQKQMCNEGLIMHNWDYIHPHGEDMAIISGKCSHFQMEQLSVQLSTF